ncbi:putative arylsulfatase [Phyllosticta citrichinensis]|uniref:Arylsulfatase n=1 Tax=Phyllosticta citrichinensis TaxID=1130410 RepID=A0ABR1Y0K1_9PEZI
MAAKRPNFLVIIADDLGFSDTGPYGGEIPTPTLDRLAGEGVTMTGFHTASACSPTRAMLLSGTDNHIAGLGQMAEFTKTRPEYHGRPGYEGYLNFRVAALPEILQDNGYHTILSGKWHLGLKKELSPHARGFDKSFVYLAGAGNHYNNEPQLGDHPFQSPSVNGDGLWMHNDQFLDRKKDLPADFYSTATFCDRMTDFLQHRTQEEKEKPFFAYLGLTAPHWPLQAPRETIAKYHGKYDAGPEALRAARLAALKARGLVPQDVTPAPMVGAVEKEWDEMNAQERAESARRMEAYAAMVDLIDAHLSRVIDQLEATDELDNTFVLFCSDNGAEGKLLESLPMMAGTPLVECIRRFYDNSLDNIGNASSFVWYGPRWAAAGTAPSRGFKAWATEGGIRCPAIVRFPPLLAPPPPGASTTTPESGAKRGNYIVSHDFTTVMDILPTFLDLAHIPHPFPSRFRNRDIVAPRGMSWVPYLRSLASFHSQAHPQSKSQAYPKSSSAEAEAEGKETAIQPPYGPHSSSITTGWELFGQRAIRRGRHKAVYIPAPLGSGLWELFDVEADPGEICVLARAGRGGWEDDGLDEKSAGATDGGDGGEAGSEGEGDEEARRVLKDLLDEWVKYEDETGLYDPDPLAGEGEGVGAYV